MNMRDADLPLLERLLNAPQGFDLFQAISLLEREGVAEGRVEIGASGGPEAVRLKSHVSLSFEASDVRNISRGAETGEAFTLSTPVLSCPVRVAPCPLLLPSFCWNVMQSRILRRQIFWTSFSIACCPCFISIGNDGAWVWVGLRRRHPRLRAAPPICAGMMLEILIARRIPPGCVMLD